MRLLPRLDPPVETLETLNPGETAFMRHFGPPHARLSWTPLTAIAPALIAATVKSEDPRFFDHHGADWPAIACALRRMARERRIVGGASTITQQLARNLYLTPERSLERKLRELWLSLRIERGVSKLRILELYLNVIEWGPGVWGCAAASARHFQNTPAELDLFASTFLASLIAAPKAALSGRNASRTRRLQTWLIYEMLLSGVADGEDCAVGIHRVSHLHRLLAAGVPLEDALPASRDVNPGDDFALFRNLAVALGLRRLTAAELLPTHCGAQQERTAIRRLRAQIGDEVLGRVLETADPAALRAAIVLPVVGGN